MVYGIGFFATATCPGLRNYSDAESVALSLIWPLVVVWGFFKLAANSGRILRFVGSGFSELYRRRFPKVDKPAELPKARIV